MTIPASITTALTSLEAQVQAAQPLSSANRAAIRAMQLNVGNLVASIQTALVTTTLIPNIIFSTDSLLLDGWVPPIDPQSIIAGIKNVSIAAENQNELSLMRGVVGRAASNLGQVI